MAEQHTLTIRPRKNQVTVDGICSCAKWRIINRSRAEVRMEHAEHIRQQLGPDGTERTQR